MQFSSPPPIKQPPVFVPDDIYTYSFRHSTHLIRQFEHIDKLRSSPTTRLLQQHLERKSHWHSLVAKSAAISPSHAGLVSDLLDDPIMAANLRKSPRLLGGGKKSPGARLMQAIAQAAAAHKRGSSSYLCKPAHAAAAAPKPKTPPVWRRSPTARLQRRFAEREAARATDAAQKESRWAAALRGSLAAAAGKTDEPATVSFDALDKFMQPAAPAPDAPPRSDLSAMCRARRREVLLEMGMDEADLHPGLRGYAVPRMCGAAEEGGVAVDSLDLLMCGRA